MPTGPSLSEDDIKRKVQELSGEKDSRLMEAVVLAERRYDEAVVDLTKLRQENEAQKNYMEQILQVSCVHQLV
jgi:hypothetical protein